MPIESGREGGNLFRRVGNVFSGGGGGGSGDRPTFNPSTTDEEEDKFSAPKAPRLATYAHGYSYSQGAYPGGAPRYTDQDVMLPARLAPWQVAELQRSLMDAGLLDDVRFGVWDKNSQNAYQTILAEANQAGVDAETLLNRYAYAAQVGGGGAGGRGGGGGGGGGHWEMGPDGEPVWVEEGFQPPPLELTLPNRDDVTKVLREAVVDKLGVGWTQQQIGELADLYIGQIRGLKTDAYRQQVARLEDEFYGRPSDIKEITEVEAPSPEAFAEKELMRRDPTGFQEGKLVNEIVPQFFQMMEGWS